ncbi:protein FAR-RED IMPAIRED RESPONSE 1 [Cajanus cajan]|uniref:protein FAR-RED IMPAIRED RESPONSE 1 n=1 Tax=Cajanus cajan TaxID=3821 RepID=UPI00098D9479|nr:protein FAR-RED IMPAIRED RESPONSE 1 [Cajanus cajan]
MANFNGEACVNLSDDEECSFDDIDICKDNDIENFEEENEDISNDSESEIDKVENVGLSGFDYKSYINLTAEEILEMEFCSEHDAYKFYFGYAKYHGFGVRKDEVGYDKNHNIVMRQFLCNKADETIETYKWVLETFLDAMCNKEPKSIVTDGDGAMWEAIKQELVVKHEVQDNNWVNEVYRKRGMWAHAYLRDKFFAGIRTTSLCEGINSCIKTYIRRKNTIVELLYNFEHSLRDFRYNELVSDYNSLYTEPVLTSSLRKIERQAANLFTRNIFKQVASEIITAGSLNVTNKFEVEDKVCFKVDKFCERDWEHNVGYDKEEGKFVCDCMMYEFCGIPCSHIICVMRYEHMECFPSSLICKRWLKDAKSSYMSSFESEVEDTDMMVMARFALLAACCNSLCSIAAKKCDSFNFVRNEVLKLKEQLDKKLQLNENIEKNDSCDPNVVKTKGAPVTKKKKKNSRKCSNCKKSGHFITCPAVVSQQHDGKQPMVKACEVKNDNNCEVNSLNEFPQQEILSMPNPMDTQDNI